MSRKINRIAFYYWLVTLIGFLASLSVFTSLIQNFKDAGLWLPITLGLSSFGCLMMYVTYNEMIGRKIVASHLKLIIGVICGSSIGLFIYFSPYLLGFFMFYLHHRRVWLLVRKDEEDSAVLLAATGHRELSNFDKEFDFLRQELRRLSGAQ